MNDLKNKDCPAVQAHIAMLQGIISRMANNSANCKTWAVTIIATMLVLIADKNMKFTDIWICYIPVVTIQPKDRLIIRHIQIIVR